MTCNRDHHVVNIVGIPESRVHHIAFELKDNSFHPAASDLLRRAGVKTQWGPSRHTAGHNLAGYHYDPEKVLLELYTEMDVFIPELGMCEARPWHEHFPMKPRSWGFRRTQRLGRRLRVQPRRRVSCRQDRGTKPRRRPRGVAEQSVGHLAKKHLKP